MGLTLHVAILGAGILGSTLALALARLGHRSTMYDRLGEPVAGASRWNEGKLHLGHVYIGDPSLGTARLVLPGGLQFRRIVESLLAISLTDQVIKGPDSFLIHRDSVVSPEAAAEGFARTDALMREMAHPSDYFADLTRAGTRRYTPAELAGRTGSDEIAAGFEVPETSINTQWLAARYGEALAGSPGIELRLGTEVMGAAPIGAADGAWRVTTADGSDGPFDAVVNALWEGRLAVDVRAGLLPAPGWSHRYRYCLFLTSPRPVPLRSAFLAIGAFGDVKNYDDRNYYLSWYPAGLAAVGHELAPPVPPPLDPTRRQAVIAATRAGLSPLVRHVDELFETADSIRVEGGYVFAKESGAIDNPAASIHRRSRFGVERRGNYFSVDTGKFSTGPWLAETLARELAGI